MNSKSLKVRISSIVTSPSSSLLALSTRFFTRWLTSESSCKLSRKPNPENYFLSPGREPFWPQAGDPREPRAHWGVQEPRWRQSCSQSRCWSGWTACWWSPRLRPWSTSRRCLCPAEVHIMRHFKEHCCSKLAVNYLCLTGHLRHPTPRIQLSVRPFVRPFVPIFYMHHTYMHQDEGS